MARLDTPLFNFQQSDKLISSISSFEALFLKNKLFTGPNPCGTHLQADVLNR